MSAPNSIFVMFLLIWLSIMLYYAYRKTLKGRIGPIWRWQVEEEEWIKLDVLNKHGVKPKRLKRKGFGPFRWTEFPDDEVEENET